MKKLTAGILASLIGLVSANSADAAVASKAYVDGAIETLDAAQVGTNAVTSFVKTVSETDGKISATAGDLSEVIISGTNVTVTPNAAGQLVIDGHAADGNTQYTFTDGEGVKFTGTYDEASDTYTYKADAVLQAGSENVTIGKSADGKAVTITVAEQDIASYTFANTATVNLEKTEDENGNFTVTATGLYTGDKDVTVAADGKISTDYSKGTDVRNNTGEDWYVLMRKSNGQGGYEYSWENIDRSYDAGDWDVAHNEGTQPAQQ